jgi:ABC-type xylose transport system permease subunit
MEESNSDDGRNATAISIVGCAAAGGAVAGPVGALVGALFGGLINASVTPSNNSDTSDSDY